MKRVLRHFALLLSSLAIFASAQSDILVSKGLGILEVSEGLVWAFELENQSYSIIDFFANPVAITTVSRMDAPFLDRALPFNGGLLGLYVQSLSDSIWEIGFRTLKEKAEENRFSFRIKPDFGLSQNLDSVQKGLIETTVQISGAVRTDSLLALGFENGGLSLLKIRQTNGEETLELEDTLHLWVLGEDDTLVNAIPCAADTQCSLGPMAAVHEGAHGPINSVDALAILPVTSDSVLLFLGSSKEGSGLRRGLAGGVYFPRVASAGLDKAPIRGIFANPANRTVWVATKNQIYISKDLGITFQVPNRPRAMPDAIIQDLQFPDMAFLGDTAIANFDFSLHPGLVLIKNDSLIFNAEASPNDFDYYLHPGLKHLDEDTELNKLAVAWKGGSPVIVAGSRNRGLYYLKNGENWVNINRRRKVEKDLREVITFPTIFDGSGPVGIGYQLSKNAAVTITVFNYAMEPVKTIVRNSERIGGGGRSENPHLDRWDGRDENGSFVSAGMYYVKVKSDKGYRGWGKVMVVSGRN